jgi:ribose transport system permease protein/inositol transport system permease protein
MRPVKAERARSVRLESLAVLILLGVAVSILSPYFLSVGNFLNILLATSVIGIIALGMTFVICMGEIDLSVGSVLAFSSVCGVLMVKPLGLPWPSVIIVAVGAGGIIGLINGLLVTKAAIPSFIATLGMLGIARGLGYVLTTERAIYGLPDPIVYLGQGRILGAPVPVLLFAATAVVAHIVLQHTRFGRHTLFIGDNAMAARVTGLRVDRHRILVFILSGTLAGAAGVVQSGRLNAADPSSGNFYELAAITAAIIGGANFFGGSGTIIGTVIGALIMGVIQNGLNLLGVEAYYQTIVIGFVLIVAVWLDRLRTRVGGR